MREEEEEEEGVVLHVACLPVTGGDGGQAMMGVLKVSCVTAPFWRLLVLLLTAVQLFRSLVYRR